MIQAIKYSDTRVLESQILGTCINQNDYEKISFLTPDDFNYYSAHWVLFQEEKGIYRNIISRLKGVDGLIVLCEMSYVDIQTMALKLVEISFANMLVKVFNQELLKCTKEVDKALISELQSECGREDVMNLVSVLPEYAQKLGLELRRLSQWSNYTESRINNIKNALK